MRKLTNGAARGTLLFATVGAVIPLLIGASALAQRAPIKAPNTETAQAVAIVCKPSGKHVIATECDQRPAGAISGGKAAASRILAGSPAGHFNHLI
jgi:hypothetical protein